MSAKAKTTQQRKLELRSAKKKNLFKKRGTAQNYLPVISHDKDETTKARVKKEIVLTKEDLELLKLFDHDRDYGPSIGITRQERWDRAKMNGLEPPEEIETILSQHPDNPEVQDCVWSKYKL